MLIFFVAMVVYGLNQKLIKKIEEFGKLWILAVKWFFIFFFVFELGFCKYELCMSLIGHKIKVNFDPNLSVFFVIFLEDFKHIEIDYNLFNL